MIQSSLWRRFESGDGVVLKGLRFIFLVGCVSFLCFTGVLELTWPQQAALGLLMVLLAMWLDRSTNAYLVTLTLMLLSVFSTCRYGFWRLTTTRRFFFAPGSNWNGLDAFFICLLLAAEAYAASVLFMGYFQTLWPLRRTPVPLPDDSGEWPAIDLLIPTYNEPLNVVKHTALAAMNIDWPLGKLNVYILDDGRRDEFRKFAEEAGIGYMTRDDNLHAKAGNINRALERLDSPFVAVFDCDHVPTRSFMQVAMGWFLRDSKLGMLQTPHHFYSPDPFERNLDQFRTIPNEDELFYGIVQDGNDFWNATFFCGSCAVIRRAALDDVGGVAVETVTEDVHTSLRMHMRGWNTAYINIPQAAGLATERLSGHIRQRIRWARGMVQILRTENPFFVRGLSVAQRLCYFNAMSHFLYALPRLIFLTAPLIYLIFGHVNIPGYWAAILAYALPHLLLSSFTNSRIQGQHRHSFWNEIYETVLAPYILLPTLFTLINPKLGRFNVTAKGGVVNRRFFDTRIAQPFLLMLGLNFTGILCAVPRFWQFPGAGSPWGLDTLANMYDGSHPGTIVMNLLWACFNLVILGVATSVAWESQQRRQTVRIPMNIPADVQIRTGSVIHGVTTDLSSGGAMIRMERDFISAPGDMIQLTLPVLDGKTILPATIVGISDKTLRLQFSNLLLHEEEALTMVLYSRADTWLGWGESRESDHPLRSLTHILRLAFRGFSESLQALMGRSPGTANGLPNGSSKPASKSNLATSLIPLLLLAIFYGAKPLQAQKGQFSSTSSVTIPSDRVQTAIAQLAQSPQPGTFDRAVSLADLGVTGSIVLRGEDVHRTIRFSLPETQLVKAAAMKLHYQFSPGLIPSVSHLNISLNGTLVATVAVAAPPAVTVQGAAVALPVPPVSGQAVDAADIASNKNSALLETFIVVPANLLQRNNRITFELIGHYKADCEDPSNSTLWSRIDTTTTFELAGILQSLPNDLKQLPVPFYDAAVDLHPVVPIVFLARPSPKALEAAGVVASWFGLLANSRPVRFPVTLGTIPTGNAIVISEDMTALPASLQVAGGSGPTIAIRENPADPYSKVLILTGNNADQLLTAARALTLQPDILQGSQAGIRLLTMPPNRQPDDAPRWLSTKQINTLSDLTERSGLQGDGGDPMSVYMRLPPDLYYGSLENLGLHLSYRYNGIPLGKNGALQVFINGSFVAAAPLPHTDNSSTQPKATVALPIAEMRPFSNTLTMNFAWMLVNSTKCNDAATPNLQGTILKDSYLDLRGIPHWAVLPNLELFANAGYPFTRKADLVDTAVVLPDTVSTEEMEIYLTLMGHFGAQTGYPVLNVTVTNPEGMTSDGSKDYLVIGTVDDQAALSRLNPSLPVMADGSGLHIQDTKDFFAQLQHGWWKVRSSDRVRTGELETVGGLPDALIEGLEWPSRSNRSVVVIALRDQTITPDFLSAFLKSSQSSDISQSVSVLHGSRFVSYRIGNDVYKIGSLSFWTKINMFFSDYPWAMVVAITLCCILLAVFGRAILRRRARIRLQG
jgi:cellulose synthase (UDP-forming)